MAIDFWMQKVIDQVEAGIDGGWEVLVHWLFQIDERQPVIVYFWH